RRLSPTEAGQAYLNRVEAILDELEKAREDALGVGAQPTGTLRMTVSVAFGQRCLVPLLPRFAEAFPRLGLELLMTDAAIELVAERVDLAIRLGPTVSGDVVCAKLMDTRYRVCASPDYLERAPSLARPEDLRRHACLAFALPDYRSRWLFRAADGKASEVPVGGRMVISNALALRDAAIVGLGPALLADWLVDDDIAAGRLVDVFPEHRVTATSFETAAWLVYPSRAFLPNKVRVTIDFLRRHLGRA
ncbi:MAG: LysR family transcriptional regulator, partial [Inquilinus sp.]|nr:LysR family transcriptional regulator [Inquilinus sp.]